MTRTARACWTHASHYRLAITYVVVVALALGVVRALEVRA